MRILLLLLGLSATAVLAADPNDVTILKKILATASTPRKQLDDLARQ
jgi:hypothetical protein